MLDILVLTKLNSKQMLNSKSDLYRNEWLELVFANRNKTYGAYELRRHNIQTTLKALVMACTLMISAVTAPDV